MIVQLYRFLVRHSFEIGALMRLRTVIRVLGCRSFAVSDEAVLDRDLILATSETMATCPEASLVLTRPHAQDMCRARGASEPVTMMYMQLQDGVSLEDYKTPAQGVVLVEGTQSFEEFQAAFRHLPELCALLSLKRARMHHAFLHSYDLKQFVGLAADIIGNPVIVTNSDHRLLACAGEIPSEREDVREVIERGYVSDGIESALEEDGIIRDVRLSRHALLSVNPRFGSKWAHSIIYSHHMELGRFDVLEAKGAIVPIDLELIDYAGTLAGVMIERAGAAGGLVGSGSSVLADLITGGFVNERTMHTQVALTQLPLGESYAMLVIVGHAGTVRDNLSRVGKRVATMVRKCLWVVQDSVLAVIVPIGRSQEVGFDDYRRLRRLLTQNRRLMSLLENNDMVAYVSEPFDELSMTQGRYAQCLSLKDALERRDDARLNFFWENRFLVLAHSAKTFDAMETMLDKRVVAMAAYDHDHSTQYLETAIMSVRYPGSPADAAGALHVHRNTYFYRVNKVRELFYIDLKDGDDRLALAFTAKVMEGMGESLYFSRTGLPDAW